MGPTLLTSEDCGELLQAYKCESQFPGSSIVLEPRLLMDPIFSVTIWTRTSDYGDGASNGRDVHVLQSPSNTPSVGLT